MGEPLNILRMKLVFDLVFVPFLLFYTKAEEKMGPLHWCVNVMTENGLNVTGFAQDTVHGIHSLSLEEIRHYFEPNATEENKIPVVNLNLLSDEPIKFHAPMVGYNKAFKTMAMKLMSYVMKNERPDFSVQGLNHWEKVGHAYHMQEIYTAAAPIYKRMKEYPPNYNELCPCVNDIVGNGVLIKLSKFAQGMRFYNSENSEKNENPEDFLRNNVKRSAAKPNDFGTGYRKWKISVPKAFAKRSAAKPKDFGKYKKWSISVPKAFAKRSAARPNDYGKYKKWAISVPKAFEKRSAAKPKDFGKYKKWNIRVPTAFAKRSISFSQTDETHERNGLKEDPNVEIQTGEWTPGSLKGPDQWESYEEMLLSSMPNEQELFNFVTFIFCKLNHGDLDLSKSLFVQ